MIESIGFVLTAGAGGLSFVLLTLLRERNNGPVFGDRCVFCLLALPLSVFLSHFLYCVVQPHMILPEKGFLWFLMPWQDGFLMYGVFCGILAAAFLTRLIRGCPAAELLDLAVMPAALFVVICRLCEPFYGQGYGIAMEETTVWTSLISYVRDPAYTDESNLAVFAMEALTALGMLLWFAADRKERPVGRRAILFITQYASMQILFEFLREDDIIKWSFVRVSQILSAACLALILIASFIRMRKKAKCLISNAVLFLLTAGVCVGMIFLDDKSFTLFGVFVDLPHIVCYAVVAVCGVLMGVFAWNALSKSDEEEHAFSCPSGMGKRERTGSTEQTAEAPEYIPSVPTLNIR